MSKRRCTMARRRKCTEPGVLHVRALVQLQKRKPPQKKKVKKQQAIKLPVSGVPDIGMVPPTAWRRSTDDIAQIGNQKDGGTLEIAQARNGNRHKEPQCHGVLKSKVVAAARMADSGVGEGACE